MKTVTALLSGILVFLVISGCVPSELEPLVDVPFTDLQGQKIVPLSEDDTLNKVFFFLTYDCPLSVNYTGPMNDMVDSFSDAPAKFYYIFPGLVSWDDSVRIFNRTYLLNAPVIGDPDYLISKTLGATVTPQVVIVNRNNQRVYTGAFDNWAFDTGRKRQVVTEHYASDALKSVISGKKPAIAETEPRGCFIEY